MRSVRLRRGVAIFSVVVLCALVLTNLFAPDAGSDSSQLFHYTYENQQQHNAFPLPADVVEEPSQQREKNRKDDVIRQNGMNWEDGKNWQENKNGQDSRNRHGHKNLYYGNSLQDSNKNRKDGENSQDGKHRHKVNTKERTGTKISSRHRDVTTAHHIGKIARDNHSLNRPRSYHNNATPNLTRFHAKLSPAVHRDVGVSNITTLVGMYSPGSVNVRNRGPNVGGQDINESPTKEKRLGLDYQIQGSLLNSSPDAEPHQRNSGEFGYTDYRYIHSSRDHLKLWPEDSDDDRILAQLDYIPRTYSLNVTDSTDSTKQQRRRTRTKRIYVPGGLSDVPSGHRKFVEDGCAVSACALTSDSRFRSSADLVLLQLDAFFEVPPTKPRDQVWVMWLLESPINTAIFRNLENVINWTATYRSDSTIVTPYEKFVLDPTKAGQGSIAKKNYAAGKSRLVAWFVSNCLADNKRWEYMLELRRYVPIDVYGACGDHDCQRDRDRECDGMLGADYKFYLSFENSNCQHYVTEKFYQRALWNDVVPIAMGARKSDYGSVAPPHSFIHVEDFSSPRHLADYLLKLNASDALYNEYFAWKERGRFVNTKFWCRLCALLHDDTGHSSWYPDIEKWWRGNATCTRNRWDDPDSLITDWAEYHRFRARGS